MKSLTKKEMLEEMKPEGWTISAKQLNTPKARIERVYKDYLQDKENKRFYFLVV